MPEPVLLKNIPSHESFEGIWAISETFNVYYAKFSYSVVDGAFSSTGGTRNLPICSNLLIGFFVAVFLISELTALNVGVAVTEMVFIMC